jgi:hypothetical protein
VSGASRERDGTFSPCFGYSLDSESRPIGTFQTVSLRTRVNKGKGAGTTALALLPMIVWLLLSRPYLAIHLLKERVAPLVALLVIAN